MRASDFKLLKMTNRSSLVFPPACTWVLSQAQQGMSDFDNNLAHRPVRSRRSVLYVPANRPRAMEKVRSLACDTVIFDLEDAVGPAEKLVARDTLRDWFSESRSSAETVVRINALSSDWGMEDAEAACAWRPDALLLPKVSRAGDIHRVQNLLTSLAAPPQLRLWAMVETPLAIANSIAIAETGRQPNARLDCLIAGTNDLAKETGVALQPGRPHLSVWLLQLVLAARTAGLDALDGVYNDFRDGEGFERECRDGRAMGFDGKTLIHPAQINATNRAFGVSDTDIEKARAIVAAFARAENSGRGVIQIDGRMVERLHLEQAETLLARAAMQTEGTGT